jgi:hypothetical protein
MTADVLDEWLARLSAGETLADDVLSSLAAGADILPLGMLADAVRRRAHDAQTTFLRVAHVEAATSGAPTPPAAREIRIVDAPERLDAALDAVAAAVNAAGGRAVAGYSWADVMRWRTGGGTADVLAQLRGAGLRSLAVIAVDEMLDIDAAVGQLADAGFAALRLHVAGAALEGRVDLWRRVDDVARRRRVIQAVNPLPARSGGRQTTGYDDVKMVATARLAAAAVPTVQLDWRRYGPKLAQVALTVGADDLDNVDASDDAPEGRRRAPLEEVRRNIVSAAFQPVERDDRFRAVAP